MNLSIHSSPLCSTPRAEGLRWIPQAAAPMAPAAAQKNALWEWGITEKWNAKGVGIIQLYIMYIISYQIISYIISNYIIYQIISYQIKIITYIKSNQLISYHISNHIISNIKSNQIISYQIKTYIIYQIISNQIKSNHNIYQIKSYHIL